MNRGELQDLAYSLASEYEEEMEGYYIREDRLTEMAKKMNPELDEIWIHRLVGFAKGLLYSWGPDTEEELEGLRSQRGGSMDLEKVVKVAIKEVLAEEYPINSVIIEEYEEIRQSGETNMIDMKRVRDIADSYGAEELVDYINEYGSKGYSYLLENYSKFKNKFEKDDQKEDEKLEQVLKDFGPDEDW